MPLFPLYFEAKEKLKDVKVKLTDEQERQRCEDRELIEALDQYQAPFRERWLRNAALYNMVQSGTDDPVANFYLGWARILINHSVATMNEGEPEGAFSPFGPADGKLAVLWQSLVKHSLNKSNWRAQQRLWLIDNHVFGGATLKAFSELPMRKKTYERADGSLKHRFVRDFRKAKVGLRQRSPFRTMRSHFVADPDDVPIGVERELHTWNSFAMKYGNAILPNGDKKYDTAQIPVGSHVRVVHIYDEDGNRLTSYACSYGGKPESTYENEPSIGELGYPMYHKPLSRYKFMDQGRSLTGGANVPGMTPLAFSIFDDQYDSDSETHALYGMGIPQLIEGPEEIMHGLVNQSLQNLTNKNTVLVGYEPNSKDSPSYLDVDLSEAYSGLMVDGKITTHPLGVSDIGSNQAMYDWVKLLMYQLAGTNPEQLTGDKLQTAFQSGLLVRQMNMRAKARINSWAGGPLKRAWTLLLANCLSEYTVEEWEEITEEDASEMAKAIENDEMTGEDFDEEEVTNDDGSKQKIYKKRHHFWFPVPGRKFREDFTGENKKRTLSYNSTKNTLIEDHTMKQDVSHVPAELKYLLPDGKIERILEFDVVMDGKPMLGDMKIQDMEMMNAAVQTSITIASVSKEVADGLDWKKIHLASVKPAGLIEKDLYKNEGSKSKLLDAAQKAQQEIEAILTSPTPDASPVASSPAAPAPQAPANAGRPATPQAQPPGPPAVLGNLANGLV